MSRWLTEGRILGESLRRFTCLVVAGRDEAATADVALGIAESQSAHRRVVLGDLFGDAARFAPMRADDDPHGIVDAFDYGISLARIVRPVAGNQRLQFAPTGADAPDYAVLLGHPRWKRLIGEFAETGELLIITLPVDAPGLDDLVYRTDGGVLVDSLAPAKLELSRVIATVRLSPLLLPAPPAPIAALAPPAPLVAPPPVAPPPLTPPPPVAPAAPSTPSRPSTSGVTPPRDVPPVPSPPRPSGTASAPVEPAKPASPRGSAAASQGRESVASVSTPARQSVASRVSTLVRRETRQTGVFTAFARPAGLGAGLSVVAAVFIFWLFHRPFAEGRRNPVSGPMPPAVLKPIPAAAAAGKPTSPNMVDPADSGAAVYAVRIMAANTQAGAILSLQGDGSSLPAATFAPVEKGGRTWYEVFTGAFTTRGGADSLLTALRADGRLDSLSPGVVVRVPFAVRIDTVRVAGTVPDLLNNLHMRQVPAYALDQGNGWIWVMVGAFETRSQADSYAEKLRANGQPWAEPVLRQGRMF